jgi:hypothetical protein
MLNSKDGDDMMITFGERLATLEVKLDEINERGSAHVASVDRRFRYAFIGLFLLAVNQHVPNDILLKAVESLAFILTRHP